MKRFLSVAGLARALTASLAVAASAQQTEQRQQGGPERAEKRGRMGRGHGQRMRGRGLRGLRRLDLSDAQRQQFRSIREAHRNRTKAQREELRQLFQARRQGGTLTAEQEARARQLHGELRQTGESVRGEMLAVLTPEQRAQLEKSRQEMKERRDEFRNRRRQMPDEDEEQ